MKIIRIADYCGGDYGEAVGHLDSQIFPCKKDPSIETRKKRKKKKTVQAVHSFPIVKEKGTMGIWEKWKNKLINDAEFVTLMNHIVTQQGSIGISKDPSVRKGILLTLKDFHDTRNYSEAAKKIGAFLSMGENVDESYFVGASENYVYKKEAQEIITGPDMSSITPDRLRDIIEVLKRKYPAVDWTVDKVKDFMRTHFGVGGLKPFTGPKDIEHYF